MNQTPPHEQWHVPLSEETLLLGQAYDSLRAIGLRQEQIPLMVQLVENPRFDLPGFDLFPGATSLETHDYIHILLGRGLCPMDEAFVLGFTMGSTNKMSATEEALYTFFTRYLYPKSYRFNDDEVAVFRDAVRLGYISDCVSLAGVDFTQLRHLTLAAARQKIGIEVPLLRAYYGVEQKRYPASEASSRLLV
jgi:hypothetical protein